VPEQFLDAKQAKENQRLTISASRLRALRSAWRTSSDRTSPADTFPQADERSCVSRMAPFTGATQRTWEEVFRSQRPGPACQSFDWRALEMQMPVEIVLVRSR